MRLTHNRGVDVVLNTASGEMLAETWDCVAPYGHHIELGKIDADKNRYISTAPFKRNASFASVDIGTIAKDRPLIFYAIQSNLMALFAEGALKPVRPLIVLPIDRLDSAFKLIADRKHIGKVVVDFTENSMVQTALPPPSPLQLRSDGTYMIGGGRGDIGRRLVKHLASRGAKHVVVLTRQNLPDEQRLPWIEESKRLGAELHIVQCDVTDEKSVQQTAAFCKQSLPPVRGIFHASVLLRVSCIISVV
jgi:NADPH:quinone reductase-like Zn-dependent oxidoreductase